GDNNTHQLIVYAGAFSPNRKFAIESLKRETFGSVVERSLSDVVTPDLEVTRQNIDRFVEEMDKEQALLICTDAEQLCGVYVGYTYSSVKYATPQEKYFLKRIQELPCSVLIVLKDEKHLDKTLERKAHTVVRFPSPTSFFEKLVWNIQKVRLNGANLASQRPV
ncbi:MAG: hypothetical protein AAFW89_12730, partial [Bacteroidota bacterium]